MFHLQVNELNCIGTNAKYSQYDDLGLVTILLEIFHPLAVHAYLFFFSFPKASRLSWYAALVSLGSRPEK